MPNIRTRTAVPVSSPGSGDANADDANTEEMQTKRGNALKKSRNLTQLQQLRRTNAHNGWSARRNIWTGTAVLIRTASRVSILRPGWT